MEPNLLLCGFMIDWKNRASSEINEFCDIIHLVWEEELSLGILFNNHHTLSHEEVNTKGEYYLLRTFSLLIISTGGGISPICLQK